MWTESRRGRGGLQARRLFDGFAPLIRERPDKFSAHELADVALASVKSVA